MNTLFCAKIPESLPLSHYLTLIVVPSRVETHNTSLEEAYSLVTDTSIPNGKIWFHGLGLYPIRRVHCEVVFVKILHIEVVEAWEDEGLLGIWLSES